MKNYERTVQRMMNTLEEARRTHLEHFIHQAELVANFDAACRENNPAAMWEAFAKLTALEGPELPTPEEHLFDPLVFDEKKRDDWFESDSAELLAILRQEAIEA